MSQPRVGVQLFTVRQSCGTIDDFTRTLERVKKIGYSNAQLSGHGKDLTADQIAQALKETGVECSCTHMNWDRFVKDLDAVIGEHRSWNCRHLAIGGLPNPYRSAEGLAQFVDELGPVMERINKEGMTFSYHNHNHEFHHVNGKGPWLQQLFDATASMGMGMEIDTYWIQAGGSDPAMWVRKSAGRIPLLHLKDMLLFVSEGEKGPVKEQRFAPIGSGNLHWAPIFEAAKQCGVEYMLVEQDQTYGKDPFDCLTDSYAFLKSMGFE